METNSEVLELQNSIKELANKLGWSLSKLARVLYTELNEVDDEDEIKKFVMSFKKELIRPTTKVERLKVYLDKTVQHPDAEKLDLVFNRYISNKSISSNLEQFMKDISQGKIYDL